MYKNQTPDSTLVTRYIQGCESSLEILIKKHKQRLYSFIYSKVQDREITEDVFQDTFIKVIRTLKLGNYNEQGKFLPWVMRISHNLIIDHFRKSNRMRSFKNTADFDIFSVISDGSLNAEKQLIKDPCYRCRQSHGRPPRSVAFVDCDRTAMYLAGGLHESLLCGCQQCTCSDANGSGCDV